MKPTGQIKKLKINTIIVINNMLQHYIIHPYNPDFEEMVYFYKFIIIILKIILGWSQANAFGF